MITVFISYASKDLELAEKFKDYLENNKPKEFNPVLVEIKKEPSKFFNEKISYYLETCDVFIPLITKNSLKSIWVNQEIGYAYNLEKKYGIKIIPIVHDRKKIVKGFIHNQMDLPFLWDKEEITNTFEEVRKYMLKEIPYPIELEIIENREADRTKGIIEGVIVDMSLENVSKRKIDHVQLGFVYKNYNIGITGLPYNFGKLPKAFEKHFPDDCTVHYIEIKEIYPHISHRFDFKVRWGTKYKHTELRIGFYVIPHGFEPRFYEGVFESDTTLLKGHLIPNTNEIINVDLFQV